MSESNGLAAADRLRKRRLELNMPIAAVARAVGVIPQRYRHWEVSFSGKPKAQFGKALADLLGVEPGWFDTGIGIVRDVQVPEVEPATSHDKEDTAATKEQRQAAGARLQARRLELGYGMQQLARMIGVPTTRYRGWERAFGGLARRRYGATLAQVLGVAPAWFDCGEGELTQAAAWDGVAMGARLAARRLELGYTPAVVENFARIKADKLGAWESSLPMQLDAWAVERLERMLQVPPGWLCNAQMVAPALGDASKLRQFSTAEVDTVAGEIQAVGYWLAIGADQPRQAKDMAGLQRARVFALAYGAEGPHLTSAKAISHETGLSEHYLWSFVRPRYHGHERVTYRLNKLERLRDIANQSMGVAIEDFEHAYRALLGTNLALEDANRFALDLTGVALVPGIALPTQAQAANGLRAVIWDDSAPSLASVAAAMSRQMISHCGAAHVMVVAGLCSEVLGESVAPKDVVKSVSGLNGWTWLSERQDWFWFGFDGLQNPAIGASVEAVSLNKTFLSIEDVHHAVIRARQRQAARQLSVDMEIPTHVLAQLLKSAPNVQVLDRDVLWCPESSSRTTLSDAELKVVDCLQANGGVQGVGRLGDALVETGLLTKAQLRSILDTCPVIQQLDGGIYGIRGLPYGTSLLGANVLTRLGRLGAKTKAKPLKPSAPTT